MSRRIQFSVQRRSVPWPNKEPEQRRHAYFEAIAERAAAVELCDAHPYAPGIVQVKRTLEAYDIEIGTVHGGHLQRLVSHEHGVSGFNSPQKNRPQR